MMYFVLLFVALAFAKPHEPHLRSHEKDISESEHFADGVHNEAFDHDAFMGRDEARRAESMTRDDGLKLLGELVDKMDVNHDGFVSQEELKGWLKKIENRYISEDVERTYEEYKSESKSDFITFDQHKQKLTEDYSDDEDGDDISEDLVKQIARDEKRFKMADQNGDGKLTKEEFGVFLHPETMDYMWDIMVDETIEELDHNKDGRIDLEEYTNDIWIDKNEEKPEWVKTEQESFRTTRDANKDGFLDRQEVRDWIFPRDYDHSESEMKHLLSQSDDNQDGKLTKEEILAHYSVFIGSQATDFGHALNQRDEL